MSVLLVCAGLLLFAPVALGHDMWIVPPESPTTAGDMVEVQLRVGHAGKDDPVRRNAQRIVRFAAAGPTVEVPVQGLDGAAAGYFRPESPGLWALAYESTEAYSELTGKRFTAYLEDEGLEAVLRLRQEKGAEEAPGRELYSRSLKSLMPIGTVYPAKGFGRVGLPLELVAETLPTATVSAAAAPVALRLFLHGEPLSDALVDVRRLDHAEPVAAGQTDASGRVSFQLGPGRWLAATVHMEASKSGKADWQSIFSTLTFVVPEQTSPSIAIDQ